MTATKTNERPGTRAVHRYCGMSASKARQVLDLIRGAGRADGRRDPDRHRARGGRDHRQGPRLGRGQRRAQRPAEPRGALRLGLLRRRGRDHEALASPGPWPGHEDPQADLPHHHHREPAPGRQARAAPHAAWRRSAPTGPAGSTPRGAGPTCPAGCRAAGPARRSGRLRRKQPLRRRRRTRTITDQALGRGRGARRRARGDRGGHGGRRRSTTRSSRTRQATESRPLPTRTRRATSRWARR